MYYIKIERINCILCMNYIEKGYYLVDNYLKYPGNVFFNSEKTLTQRECQQRKVLVSYERARILKSKHENK